MSINNKLPLEGLACSAAARGEAQRAARLFGGAATLREAVGYHQTPRERALGEPYLDAARSRLSEAEWEVEFAEGRNMGLEEAVEYALSEEETTTPVPPAADRPSANVSSALTRREKEIAALVARDLTNRQIAKELVVSERTVENHVANILKKLGLHSRERVAASITQR